MEAAFHNMSSIERKRQRALAVITTPYLLWTESLPGVSFVSGARCPLPLTGDSSGSPPRVWRAHGAFLSKPQRAALCLRWFAALAVLAPQGQSSAQATPVGARLQLVGVVRDAAGAALEGVIVTIPGMNVRTDIRGAFELFTVGIDTVTISFRNVGYEPIDALLAVRNKMWDTVLVQMEQSAQRLGNVKVSENRTRAALGLRDFEERRARGIGTFITREDIVERGASRLSDLLRTKRGVNVIRGKVRFVANTSGSRNTSCQPYIWLDGTLSRGMEVDEILPSTVEAMELYPYFSTIPVEFQSIGNNTAPCGTIVIWTRIPGGKAK
jgi:hypothetical protein